MRFEEFLNERKYLLGVSPKTIIYYQCAFNAWTKHSGDGKPATWIKNMLESGIKPVSVNTYICALNAYWKWEGTDQKLKYIKEEEQLLRVFTSGDIQSIIRFKPTSKTLQRARSLCLLLADSGLRISEALGIAEADIDFENCLIRVKGKGSKFRQIPISLEGRKILYVLNREKVGIYLFGTRTGTAMSVRNALRDVKQLCKRLKITGVRCSPHTLRHTFATNWIRKGGDLYMLSRVLGHSSINVTACYLKSLGVADIAATSQRVSLLSR